MNNPSTQTLAVAFPAREEGNYPVTIGVALHEESARFLSLGKYSKVAVILDAALAGFPRYPGLVGHPHHVLSDRGESSKSFDATAKLLSFFQQEKLDRSSCVVALGGGATGDAVSFAASIYMRGMAVVQMPTTLLSMVDSSIGGKTAVNLGEVKNLIGTFYNPAAVFVDLSFLATLPTREFASGFSEIIKHGVITDIDLFQMLQEKVPCRTDTDSLSKIVTRSLEIKKKVVEQDPHEYGIRKILNFGHTIGHAIESWSHQTKAPMLHGEAISLGMIAESVLAGTLYPEAVEIFSRLTPLLKQYDLPTLFPNMPVDFLLKKIALDKKNVGGSLRFSLPERMGTCLYDQAVDSSLVQSVLEKLIDA